jgi:hypothetical protein
MYKNLVDQLIYDSITCPPDLILVSRFNYLSSRAQQHNRLRRQMIMQVEGPACSYTLNEPLAGFEPLAKPRQEVES